MGTRSTHAKADALTIMIVDDIPLMRTMLTKCVTTLARRVLDPGRRDVEIRVLEAPNGKIALEKLGEQKVDVIFLDLMMPEMDGLTFLDRKREIPKLASIPVIICSAVGEDSIVEKARSLGAASYVTKPFKMTSIESELRRSVERRFS